MKTIILIILAGICTPICAQPVQTVKPSSTKFSPVSEKLKKLSSASSLSKMKPYTGFVLSSAKLIASNNWHLSFVAPEYVNYQEVAFYFSDGSHLNSPALNIQSPANMGGVYVFELNIALHHSDPVFNFKVICGGVTQVISVTNNIIQDQLFSDNKLVFAITIPNTASWVQISTESGEWKFRNCEVTPMK